MKIREFFWRTTQQSTDLNMNYLNKVLNEDKEMSELSVHNLSAIGHFLKDVGNSIQSHLLGICEHKTLVTEDYKGQHDLYQTCSKCFAQRSYYDTGEVGFAMSSIWKWTEWRF